MRAKFLTCILIASTVLSMVGCSQNNTNKTERTNRSITPVSPYGSENNEDIPEISPDVTFNVEPYAIQKGQKNDIKIKAYSSDKNDYFVYIEKEQYTASESGMDASNMDGSMQEGRVSPVTVPDIKDCTKIGKLRYKGKVNIERPQLIANGKTLTKKQKPLTKNVYQLSVALPVYNHSGSIHFWIGSKTKLYTAHLLRILDINTYKKNGKNYLKELQTVYNKGYGKYARRITHDLESGKTFEKAAPYYKKAYNAAEKTDRELKDIIKKNKYISRGIIETTDDNIDMFTIKWANGKADGAKTQFNWYLGSRIGGVQEPVTITYKPVIYLYPEKKTDVSVQLDTKGRLTTLYPFPDNKDTAYKAVWNVTADKNGTLTDRNGQTYNYLYWEGLNDGKFDFSKGFCIKGSDTAEFLEQKLAELGLTRKEANEFIVYWLPQMQGNPYNVISFQTKAYTDKAKLKITPKPDTMIRVFMAWYPSDKQVNIPEQKIKTPERKDFTAVEWGGSRVRQMKAKIKRVYQ